MVFRFHRLRFLFVALDPLHFAPGKAGNTLRGAFGSIFRQIACVPQCRDSKHCEVRETCAYTRIFEPVGGDDRPSGLADPPRPFVFRAAHLDGRTVAAGSEFHFDVHLFDLAVESIGYFVLIFGQLGREGLGAGRGRAVLTGVEALDLVGGVTGRIFDGGSMTSAAEVVPCSVDLAGKGGAADAERRRVRIRFVTPLELKAGSRIVERPEFGVLLARLRDRIGTLGSLYGSGGLELDFAEFGRRAEAVAMVRCELGHVAVERFSTRTRQTHSLGGIVGVAEYEGVLGEFLPFLVAGQFTGVGRQTTWGKGEIRVEDLGPGG